MTPRGPQRRVEDFEREVSRWAYLLSVHRGKVVLIVSAIASLATWFLTTAGYRYTGPKDEIVKLRLTTDSERRDIAALQRDGQRRDSALTSFGRDLKFVIYNQCLQVRTGDKYAQAKCLESQKEP